jgi:hypothetical protein
MPVHFWNEIFSAIVRSFPALFLIGTPVLLLVVALAALADAKMPPGRRHQFWRTVVKSKSRSV